MMLIKLYMQRYQLQKYLFVLNMISMVIKGIRSDLPLSVRIDAFDKAEKRQLEYESHIFLICNFLTLFPLLFILLSLTTFFSCYWFDLTDANVSFA